MRRIMFIALLLLTGCATAPTQTNNVCAVFDQRDGFFNNWYKQAKGAEDGIWRAGSHPHGDDLYGIRFSGPGQTAAYKTVWLYSLDTAIHRLWVFPGTGWNMGGLPARNRPLDGPAYRLSATLFVSLAGTMRGATR